VDDRADRVFDYAGVSGAGGLILFMLIVLLQVALPLGLLAWLASRPAQGWFAFLLQAASIGAVLLALLLAVMWIMPPWPLPWLYLAAFVAVVAWRKGMLFVRTNGAWREGYIGSAGVIAICALGVAGGSVVVLALQGRRPPDLPIASIHAPFAGGHYLVASGGSNVWVNAHVRTLDAATPRYEPWRGQSYGVDLMAIDAWGGRAHGVQPQELNAYRSYGVLLRSPCAGSIVWVTDGLPDLPIGQQDMVNRAGNFVMVDCGEFVVCLAHLRRGSIVVKRGQSVALGAALGNIGNSGQSSEPHLHIHAQRTMGKEYPLAGEPLPLFIHGRYLVRNDRLSIADHAEQ
jgi:hypothetical protein